MPRYNPNSTWGSKNEPDHYVPKGDSAAPPPTPEEEVEEADEAGPRRLHLFLWAAGIFAAVIAVGAFLILYFRQPAGPNVGLEFTKPDQVMTGSEFELDISPANNSSDILKNVTLSVSLPDNVSFIGQSPGQRVMQETLGDLGPGTVTPQRFELIVTGAPASVQPIDAKLTYNTASSPNSQFETDGSADIIVSGPSLSLSVNAPSLIYSGQDFQFSVAYVNNTSEPVNGADLSIDYPPAFVFTGASVVPTGSNDNSWNIGLIAPGATGTITVTGSVNGTAGASYSMDGAITGVVQGNTYMLNEASANIAVGQEPLSLSVSVDGTPNYVSHLNDNLTYTVSFVNDSDVTFENMTVQATLAGALFNLSTLRTDGSLSSLTNTVTWNGATTPTLLSLAPGQSGSVTFSVMTASSYPIKQVSDKNFKLKVNASISSATVPTGVSASSTVSTADISTDVGGQISLASEGFWSDPAAGIANTGPFPPRVNQPTDYTIHWVVTNYATDMSNVTLSATLQSGTTCTGVLKSNMPTMPVCNMSNGSVTWTIPVVPATTGITGSPAQAVFQVVNTPAVNQVGGPVTLLSGTTLTATDDFTSSSVSESAPPITTQGLSDPSMSQNSNKGVAP